MAGNMTRIDMRCNSRLALP
ncbi:hypothetical protein PENNAL_c0263G09874 [Penicillium nalgiovense]|uniref:Uncharacterized protein n=1 Tax=Penicillium nalgiovense TaxID=60175 RepID=A0A1V6WID9_PENNA|nr:hypothetical protein PENNAL_c0263G09874 [Penicillium nalgiovense]